LMAHSNDSPAYKESVSVELSDDLQKSLTRQVAYEYLQSISHDDERANIAVKYQLMDETTAFVMTEENELADTQDFPAFRKVSQMIAAAWSGQGVINNNVETLSDASISMISSASESYDMSYLEIPAFLRRQDNDDIGNYMDDDIDNDMDDYIDDDWDASQSQLRTDNNLSQKQQQLSEFINLFSQAYQTKKINIEWTEIKLSDLMDLGLPDNIAEELLDIIHNKQVDENELLLYFLHTLYQRYLDVKSPLISISFSVIKAISSHKSAKDMIDNFN